MSKLLIISKTLLKKSLIIFLMVSGHVTAKADGLSVLAGGAFLGSEFGYSVQVGSPLFKEDRWSIQAQYFEMLTFEMIEVGVMSYLVKEDPWRLGFRNMLEFFLDEGKGRGLNYIFLGEYIVLKNLSLNLEAGFSLAFENKQAFGLSLLFGPRLYLW